MNISPRPDLGGFVTIAPLVVQIPKLTFEHTVRAGFLSDGASIPRLFWRITTTPFDPRVLRGAFVHDDIYREKDHYGYERKFADKVFKKLIIQDGISKALADTMYSAVRLGGRWAWK